MAAPPPHPFVYIDAAALHSLLPFPSLIRHLRAGLAHPELSAGIQCPQRVSFPLPTAPSAALLLMPSWCAHPSLPYLALKAVTGNLDDIHDATIAATRAQVTLELVSAVRNKGVDAFNEIMRMQA